MSDTAPSTRRIGEIAEATGLTVRTLRHYEEVGLIEPAGRSDRGQRLYGPGEVSRLYQIAMLRDVGMPLETVKSSLDSDRSDLQSLMTRHLASVDEQLAQQLKLRARLSRMVQSLNHRALALDELLELMEDMNMNTPTIDTNISLLVYADLEASFEWLQRVFGLGPGELTVHDGVAVHGALEAGNGMLWLHPESAEYKLASPAQLGASSATMAVMVDDVDAHFAFAKERGAEIRYEPMDQPYGYREYGAWDCEGHLWSFMKPLV